MFLRNLLLFGGFCDEESGDGSGNAGGVGNPLPGEERKFTQADLDRVVRDRLKKSKAEIEKLKESQAATEATTQRLLSEIEDLRASRGSGDDDPQKSREKQGDLELRIAKLERMNQGLEEQVRQETQLRQKAEAERREVLRDQLLTTALTKAGCKDIKAGFRYFAPDLELDEDDDQEKPVWKLKTPSGALLSLDDGVQELLPDYLRSPAMRGGGSGASATSAKQKQKQTELAAAESQLETLQKKVRETGGNSDAVAQFSLQKKAVQRLRAELASST